jgi:hypothetical protein
MRRLFETLSQRRAGHLNMSTAAALAEGAAGPPRPWPCCIMSCARPVRGTSAGLVELPLAGLWRLAMQALAACFPWCRAGSSRTAWGPRCGSGWRGSARLPMGIPRRDSECSPRRAARRVHVNRASTRYKHVRTALACRSSVSGVMFLIEPGWPCPGATTPQAMAFLLECGAPAILRAARTCFPPAAKARTFVDTPRRPRHPLAQWTSSLHPAGCGPVRLRDRSIAFDSLVAPLSGVLVHRGAGLRCSSCLARHVAPGRDESGKSCSCS